MFYLSQFLILIKKHPLRGISFFALGTLAVFTSLQNELVEKYMRKIFFTPEENAYFHSVIFTEVDELRIRKKLVDLPGIKKVQLINPDIIKDKTNALLDSYGLDSNDEILKLNQFGFKITFEEGVHKMSQDLVRSYMIKLIGVKNIVLGPVKNKKYTGGGKNVLLWLHEWGSYLICLIFFTGWLFSGLLIMKSIRRSSYITEQFQRRNHVAIKTYGAGTLLIAALGISLAWNLGKVNWIGVIAPGILLLVGLIKTQKEYQWED